MRIPLACTVLFLAGCAHGPTLSEAAGRLESDSRGVLDAGARRLGTPGARPAIILNTRRPCGGDKARQVWRGTVPLRRGPDPQATLDGATDVTIGLARARGYRLEGPPALTGRFRVFTMAHDGLRDNGARAGSGSDVHLVIRLYGGPHSSMRLDAFTPCLPHD